MKRLTLTSLGQIREADISFGDLTVFVGEQASGKSILLQLVKLILDAGNITQTLKKHGFDWQKKTENFLSLYFGEGMETIWNKDLEGQSTYHWISTGKTASSVKRGKYLQILAQNGTRGPDSILRADTIP